jgi:hypothetical protein
MRVGTPGRVRTSLPQILQFRLRLLYTTAPHDLATLALKFVRVVVPSLALQVTPHFAPRQTVQLSQRNVGG